MPENVLRHLPSIDQLLRRDGLRDLIATAGRDAVRDRLREILSEIRREIVSANGAAKTPADSEAIAGDIEVRLSAKFDQRRQSRTQRVINATGVTLHTNLGRAPLSLRAIEAITEASGYC
ncbi:MAG TPA: L-seryl-tRNA(Sec) selenium transferase, partial [Blastocatellia bacterium]